MEEKTLIKTKTLTIEVEEYSDRTYTVATHSNDMADHELVGLFELLKWKVLNNFTVQAGAFPGEQSYSKP